MESLPRGTWPGYRCLSEYGNEELPAFVESAFRKPLPVDYMQLQGKTALIAGAARNNGRVIALTFARAGADLVLVAQKSKDDLEQVARECEALGAKALPLLADLSDHEQVNRIVQSGLEHFGKVDVLVSVAGMRPHKDFWKYDYDEWQQVFAVNVHATFYLAKALAPSMMKRKSGSIIALGGRASLTSEPIGAAVVASKHGLYGLIKSLALELGPYGIRANLLALSNIQNKRLNPEWYAAERSCRPRALYAAWPGLAYGI